MTQQMEQQPAGARGEADFYLQANHPVFLSKFQIFREAPVQMIPGPLAMPPCALFFKMWLQESAL